MKHIITLVLAIATAFGLVGCNAIGQNQATIEEGAGNAWVLFKLAKVDPSPAGSVEQQVLVSTMGRIESDLVSFGKGVLTANELGYVNSLLANEKLLVPTNANPQVVDQITSLINIFAQNVVNGSNGTVTPTQALAQGVIANAVLGIKNGVQYYEGKWSASNPGTWPVPPTPPTASLRNHINSASYYELAMR